MTENEKEVWVAIEHLKARNMSAKHIDMAIQALEEIQQYRAIGTVEELKEAKVIYNEILLSEGKLNLPKKCVAYEVGKLREKELREYKAIGTIEELKALKNKHIGKDNMVISSSDLMTILNSDSEELKQYKEVGTVEELQALKEKSVEKKVKVKPKYNKGRRIDAYFCPSCDKFICFIGEVHSTTITKTYIYCNICGQKLDWIE